MKTYMMTMAMVTQLLTTAGTATFKLRGVAYIFQGISRESGCGKSFIIKTVTLKENTPCDILAIISK